VEIQDVDATLRTEFSKKSTSSLATFHNAWGYFAAEYGLTVSTTFEEFPGESPTPAYLTEFSDTIRKNNISFVFAEPQFSTKQLEPIASDLGLQIRTIDPIGGSESIRSFAELLLYNGLEISKSLN
jgi:zinc transport system substrate-binding protein